MRRRWFIPAAVLAAMALALGACGGDDGDGGETAAGDGTVTVLSLWGGSEQEAFQKVLDAFAEEKNIQAQYESARDFLPVIRSRLAAGNPPEVAIIPRPGILRDLANEESLVSLEDLGLDPDAINENYSQAWTDLTTVDGTVYGVMAKANSKATVWYKPQSFQAEGFEVPTTWDQLLEITNQYVSKGKKPWAVGAQGKDNSWTLTDWFENIYLRQSGPDMYEQLFSGELEFTDQSVKDAITEMLKIVNDETIPGGVDGVLGTDFVSSIGQVFGTNPTAEMHGQGGFVGGIAIDQVNPDLTPGEDIDFFAFPEINSEHGTPLMGAGDITAVFVNNEDAKALVEYLSTPEAGRTWVSTGAIVSPHKGVTDDAYPNDLVAKEAQQVKEAEVFRFDGSDLLPGALGQDWGTVLQNVVKNPNNTDSLLEEFQADAEDTFGGA
jgi:alpha-glucoside transport system substrate-binding protein